MCVVAVRALPYGGSREEGREGRRGAMSPRGARPSASWGSAGQLLERQVGEEASLAEVVEGPLGRTACRGELRQVRTSILYTRCRRVLQSSRPERGDESDAPGGGLAETSGCGGVLPVL